MGGDFNEVLTTDEKSGGLTRAVNLMEGFRNGLTDCDLVDLGYSGYPFTWSNQRTEPHTVRCRLDHFNENSLWSEFAPLATVQHLGLPGSDHVPLLLHVRGQRGGRLGRRHRRWRFNAHWIRKEECEAVMGVGDGPRLL